MHGLLRWFIGFLIAVSYNLSVQAQTKFAESQLAISPATSITVAAASDLKFALASFAADFEKSTGHKVKLIFGSSGNFKTQIMAGAPFHLFMSADEGFVYQLADAGKTNDRGRAYAMGRIGIFVPHGSVIKADGQLKNLAQAIRNGDLKKFAIANPEHAPYGARAKEALQHAGLWGDIQTKLVLGENISQAAQFAASGSTQGGIIAQSLALSPAIQKLGSFDLIPDTWHQPLRQRMVVLKNAPAAAQQFANFLLTPAAQTVWVRYGFVLPND